MRGGKRLGAGAPKGSKQKRTVEKELALKEMRQQVLREIWPLMRSALDSARGLTIMYQKKKVKNAKTGKYERTGELVRVVDQNRVEELLRGDCSGDDWYYITTKDPNIQALKELLERTFGKVTESLEISGAEGGPLELNVALKNKIDKIYGK